MESPEKNASHSTPGKLSLQLFYPQIQSLSEWENAHILSGDLFSKIKIKHPDTSGTPPIIHLFSCYSGAAQYHLKGITGNFILCTYSEHNEVSNTFSSKYFMNLRAREKDIKSFVINNLEYCAAVGFSISCKIKNKIVSYQINPNILEQHSDISLDLKLAEEKNKFIKFCGDVDQLSGQSLLEKYTKPISTASDNLKEDKSLCSLNIRLITKISNDHPISEINRLVEKTKLISKYVLYDAITYSLDLLKEILPFSSEEPAKQVLIHAINIDNSAVVELILRQFPELATKEVFLQTVVVGNLAAVKIFLRQFPELVTKDNISIANMHSLGALEIMLPLTTKEDAQKCFLQAVVVDNLAAVEIFLRQFPELATKDSISIACIRRRMADKCNKLGKKIIGILRYAADRLYINSPLTQLSSSVSTGGESSGQIARLTAETASSSLTQYLSSISTSDELSGQTVRLTAATESSSVIDNAVSNHAKKS